MGIWKPWCPTNFIWRLRRWGGVGASGVGGRRLIGAFLHVGLFVRGGGVWGRVRAVLG